MIFFADLTINLLRKIWVFLLKFIDGAVILEILNLQRWSFTSASSVTVSGSRIPTTWRHTAPSTRSMSLPYTSSPSHGQCKGHKIQEAGIVSRCLRRGLGILHVEMGTLQEGCQCHRWQCCHPANGLLQWAAEKGTSQAPPPRRIYWPSWSISQSPRKTRLWTESSSCRWSRTGEPIRKFSGRVRSLASVSGYSVKCPKDGCYTNVSYTE